MTEITNKNTALLIIDVVNFCCTEKCESKIRQMVPKLVRFIDSYKKRFGGQVIYINCARWDKKHLPDNIIELYKEPKCRYYCADKTSFSEKFYLVSPEKDDVIITKNTYDAFAAPQLDRLLKKRKIKYLAITGVFGDGCVHATIQGGFSQGYNFVILKDLIETTDEKVRQDIQRLLKRWTWPVMFGKTIDSEEFLKKFC